MSRSATATRDRKGRNRQPPENFLISVQHRRVRVTATSRRNDIPPRRNVQFETLDSSTRTEIVDPNWHRSRSLHKECEWKQGESAVMSTKELWEDRTQLAYQGTNPNSPFPVSPQGKAGAGGFPPRRKNCGSPRKRASPLARSPKRTRERFLLTEGGLLMEALTPAGRIERLAGREEVPCARG